MPRTLDTTFTSEKNKETNQPVFLYIIHEYDGTNNLYLAEYNTDIVYGGISYSSFPISHEFVNENTQGEVVAVKVKVSNVSRLIQAYLEAYDGLRRKKVTIRQVFANQLADADAYTDNVYYIDEIVADQTNVEFNLTSKFDILDITLPYRVYSRNYCGWKFGSTECGYSGSETTCDKTLTRCRVLENQERFGGFPSVPSKRIFASW